MTAPWCASRPSHHAQRRHCAPPRAPLSHQGQSWPHVNHNTHLNRKRVVVVVAGALAGAGGDGRGGRGGALSRSVGRPCTERERESSGKRRREFVGVASCRRRHKMSAQDHKFLDTDDKEAKQVLVVCTELLERNVVASRATRKAMCREGKRRCVSSRALIPWDEASDVIVDTVSSDRATN